MPSGRHHQINFNIGLVSSQTDEWLPHILILFNIVMAKHRYFTNLQQCFGKFWITMSHLFSQHCKTLSQGIDVGVRLGVVVPEVTSRMAVQHVKVRRTKYLRLETQRLSSILNFCRNGRFKIFQPPRLIVTAPHVRQQRDVADKRLYFASPLRDGVPVEQLF